MRLTSAALLILIAHTASGQTQGDTLSISFRGSILPTTVRAVMEQEVEELMLPAAKHIEWNWTAERSATRLAVIKLTGDCDAQKPVRAAFRFTSADPHALGRTTVIDGEVLPFANVSCDAVRGYIAPELRAAPSYDREQMLGRALGRVLAHELYHILLRTRDHGHEGLARAAQSSAELVAARSTFGREEQQRLSDYNGGAEAGR